MYYQIWILYTQEIFIIYISHLDYCFYTCSINVVRPASIIDQIPEPPFDHEGTRDDVNEASGQSKYFNSIHIH